MRKQRLFAVQYLTKVSKEWRIGYGVETVYIPGFRLPVFDRFAAANSHAKSLRKLYKEGGNPYGYRFRTKELVSK